MLLLLAVFTTFAAGTPCVDPGRAGYDITLCPLDCSDIITCADTLVTRSEPGACDENSVCGALVGETHASCTSTASYSVCGPITALSNGDCVQSTAVGGLTALADATCTCTVGVSRQNPAITVDFVFGPTIVTQFPSVCKWQYTTDLDDLVELTPADPLYLDAQSSCPFGVFALKRRYINTYTNGVVSGRQYDAVYENIPPSADQTRCVARCGPGCSGQCAINETVLSVRPQPCSCGVNGLSCIHEQRVTEVCTGNPSNPLLSVELTETFMSCECSLSALGYGSDMNIEETTPGGSPVVPITCPFETQIFLQFQTLGRCGGIQNGLEVLTYANGTSFFPLLTLFECWGSNNAAACAVAGTGPRCICDGTTGTTVPNDLWGVCGASAVSGLELTMAVDPLCSALVPTGTAASCLCESGTTLGQIDVHMIPGVTGPAHCDWLVTNPVVAGSAVHHEATHNEQLCDVVSTETSTFGCRERCGLGTKAGVALCPTMAKTQFIETTQCVHLCQCEATFLETYFHTLKGAPACAAGEYDGCYSGTGCDLFTRSCLHSEKDKLCTSVPGDRPVINCVLSGLAGNRSTLSLVGPSSDCTRDQFVVEWEDPVAGCNGTLSQACGTSALACRRMCTQFGCRNVCECDPLSPGPAAYNTYTAYDDGCAPTWPFEVMRAPEPSSVLGIFLFDLETVPLADGTQSLFSLVADGVPPLGNNLNTWSIEAMCGLYGLSVEYVVYRIQTGSPGAVTYANWHIGRPPNSIGPAYPSISGTVTPTYLLSFARCRCFHPLDGQAVFDVWRDNVTTKDHNCDSWLALQDAGSPAVLNPMPGTQAACPQSEKNRPVCNGVGACSPQPQMTEKCVYTGTAYTRCKNVSTNPYVGERIQWDADRIYNPRYRRFAGGDVINEFGNVYTTRDNVLYDPPAVIPTESNGYKLSAVTCLQDFNVNNRFTCSVGGWVVRTHEWGLPASTEGGTNQCNVANSPAAQCLGDIGVDGCVYEKGTTWVKGGINNQYEGPTNAATFNCFPWAFREAPSNVVGGAYTPDACRCYKPVDDRFPVNLYGAGMVCDCSGLAAPTRPAMHPMQDCYLEWAGTLGSPTVPLVKMTAVHTFSEISGYIAYDRYGDAAFTKDKVRQLILINVLQIPSYQYARLMCPSQTGEMYEVQDEIDHTLCEAKVIRPAGEVDATKDYIPVYNARWLTNDNTASLGAFNAFQQIWRNTSAYFQQTNSTPGGHFWRVAMDCSLASLSAASSDPGGVTPVPIAPDQYGAHELGECVSCSGYMWSGPGCTTLTTTPPRIAAYFTKNTLCVAPDSGLVQPPVNPTTRDQCIFESPCPDGSTYDINSAVGTPFCVREPNSAWTPQWVFPEWRQASVCSTAASPECCTAGTPGCNLGGTAGCGVDPCSPGGHCDGVSEQCVCETATDPASLCTVSLCAAACDAHGTCTRNGPVAVECICDPGWLGVACETPWCATLCQNGQCDTSDQNKDPFCACDTGFAGSVCERDICPNACSGNGVCNQDGSCTCSGTWTGVSCEFDTNQECAVSGRDVCAGKGVCKDVVDEGDHTFLCECDEQLGYTGELCTEAICPEDSGALCRTGLEGITRVCEVSTGVCQCSPPGGWLVEFALGDSPLVAASNVVRIGDVCETPVYTECGDVVRRNTGGPGDSIQRWIVPSLCGGVGVCVPQEGCICPIGYNEQALGASQRCISNACLGITCVYGDCTPVLGCTCDTPTVWGGPACDTNMCPPNTNPVLRSLGEWECECTDNSFTVASACLERSCPGVGTPPGECNPDAFSAAGFGTSKPILYAPIAFGALSTGYGTACDVNTGDCLCDPNLWLPDPILGCKPRWALENVLTLEQADNILSLASPLGELVCIGEYDELDYCRTIRDCSQQRVRDTPQGCDCRFPWTNYSGSNCTTHECTDPGSMPYTVDNVTWVCLCDFPTVVSGPTCNVSLCAAGSSQVPGEDYCDCPVGRQGPLCDMLTDAPTSNPTPSPTPFPTNPPTTPGPTTQNPSESPTTAAPSTTAPTVSAGGHPRQRNIDRAGLVTITVTVVMLVSMFPM